MKRLKDEKYIVIPMAVGIFEFAWLYIIMNFFIKNNMLIKLGNITWDNIIMRFVGDYCVMLLLPTILIIIGRKHLSDYGLCFESKKETFFLLGVMIIFFFLHNDFTITGLYKFFFFLVVVGFGEEFIYRGFLYNKLKDNSKVMAIILSGVLWGICHAILPSLLNNLDTSQFLSGMCSEIGGGIAMGCYFIYLQEKSKTLWIPILIHAILDYSFGYIGVYIAIGAFFYFMFKAKVQIYLYDNKFM